MTSISNTINSSFLRRLQGLNPASKGSNPVKSALSGGSVSISDTLRFGARTFASSVQRLNIAIGGVNVAQTGLEGLRGLVNEMIEIADKAALSSTGNGTRRRLNSRFQQLGEDFVNIIDELNGQEFEYLTKEGLKDVLLQAGLDPDESDGIAELFAEFVGQGTEGLLVSDDIQPEGPVRFRSASTGDSAPQQISAGVGVTSTKVTALGAAFAAVDDSSFKGNNAANVSIVTSGLEGTVRTLAESLSADVTLVGSAPSGLLAISSQQDFEGFNSGGVSQLFVVDSSLTVSGQVTNITDPNVAVESAAISDDGLTAVTREFDSGTGFSSIVLYEGGSLGEDPALTTRTVLASGISSSAFEPVISRSGEYVAYGNDSGGVEFLDVATKSSNSFIASQSDVVSIGFTKSTELAVLKSDGSGGSEVGVLEYSASNYGGVIATGLLAVTSGSFATLQDEGGGAGYVAFLNNSEQVEVLDTSGNAIVSFDFSGATITDLGLAPRGSSNQVVVGSVAQFAGDAQAESYLAQQGARESSNLPKFQSLFDGEANLLSRRAAVSVRANLEAIGDRIDANINALESARSVISDNLDLVRASGFAFLDISNSISSEAEADEVATLLARRIRENAVGVLDQAENLELMVVAALTSDGGPG